ncbi:MULTISPECIES: GNAT family N-acetyltransferase [Paenibacillus]|jgi:GNAT superfamily N-acetyltransferase|uniref:Acetyltransferase n=2 Tax=Paenibacillus TaxID=44249 RepID=A0AAJ3J063_PAEPO|nr:MULTISPECIES: GNAT family N-acetyltransferase [Paenibacillus]AHC19524.1 acetyltransferase [Paenibacillus polymyxa CR1]ALA41783.1 acetyltransferase [Paenibacillus peoriae]APB76511.1 N-acetyltransferase [Paenibacillus polymyxa]MCP3744979.1 GNAT family N-acetyltransferase [Paenibacillus sp. A3M_27_13]MDH2329591.1 GNAT family N-acetyltransferase [Paenibacillus polymyxa]
MKRFTLRQSHNSDIESIANLRAIVLRNDLTRLGRFDEEKVRQRFRDAFDSVHTWIIEEDSSFVGCIAFKPRLDGYLLEHFYIHPSYQGKGVGSQILKNLLEQNHVKGKHVTLNVLQGSSARRLYERFGFKIEREDPIDVYMYLIVEGHSKTVERS